MMTLSITTLAPIFILSAVMLNAVMLNVVMLNVVMLNVVAPWKNAKKALCRGKKRLCQSYKPLLFFVTDGAAK
jgi:hypothetical protein